MINWSAKHFTLKEAIWLPQWGRIASPSELSTDVLRNLQDVFARLDSIRELFDRPISVHCAFRPDAYNRLVKGAKNSAHLYGQAVDFSVQGVPCDTVRKILLPRLDTLGLRMEDLPGSGWVHIDTRPPGPGGRFFKP